ncbi:MAG: helix-turn-helix domain-containing protein [Deltaproteobacteria bacterium]|jgi:DNA-binding XRE family transcriptional regulator|nr:helix-turn-helix domain-containing protein [Deltaproteobacteria bacterium]
MYDSVTGSALIKQARLGQLLSQAKLASLCGLSTQTIRYIEKGMACRPSTMLKVANTLGLAPWQLGLYPADKEARS